MINNINILHVGSDGKFIDDAYKSFESVAPSCNTFCILSRDTFYVFSQNKTLKYIKETPAKIISPYSFKNPLFIRSLEKYDFIVLHTLNLFNQGILANTKSDLKFVWIGYGYDYYDLIYEDPNMLYQEKTRAIVKYLTSKKNDSAIRDTPKRIAKRMIYSNNNKKTLVKKISFFSPVLENEYRMVASKFDSPFPRYAAWNYGGSFEFLSNNEEMKCSNPKGNNILVGNSAASTNNHVEVFDLLRTQNLGNRKIICPLSYGNPTYAKIINNKGMSYFDENFLGLDTFMPREDYFKLIGTCSNVIMNHHRQQALGNIIVLLFMGANIFLNRINPVYQFLKEKGAIIYTIDELSNSPDLLDTRLSEDDVEQNRQILESLYGKKAILDKTEQLIMDAVSFKNSD